ncbi:MAG: 1-deoxy-D-xylulose-5-phosphate synthase [Clostridia bacterium]|nr:1-deoxy-D-xylulose-5-phosphate synthase [Clostridia bacterium]
MLQKPLLETIKQPQDIKNLDYEDIAALASEIRGCLIENVSNNGGHLASNLGVVELTMAIHRTFDSPRDQIIFDVGHQCYVHKLLTGRYEQFRSLRKEDGLSGFPNPIESEHDILKTGHSSTAISSAVGLLKAHQLKGENDRCVIAVVGDGAMTGGLSYEGLNNGGRFPGNLIVILNDNELSISQNVGSVAAYLSKIRSRRGYFRFKDFVSRLALGTPLIGRHIYRFFQRIKQTLKSVFYQGNIFENMGFAYMGPIDGHNQRVLERVLKRAKGYKKPCLIHVKTVKGKGYSFAEDQPTDFHGLSSFDVETGAHGAKPKADFSEVFGDELCQLAEKDDKICAITAAMGAGCGLSAFAKKYPNRFFDVGIAEQHAITFAGGLAKNGMKPFFAVYSSFLQRGFDQIIHDLALQQHSATICVDRAGIVGEDGETHQGLFDVPMLLSIPGITIYSPTCYEELRTRLRLSAASDNGVHIIRYPRGCEPDMTLPFNDYSAPVEWLGNSDELCVISYGRQVVACLSGIRKANRQVSFLKLNQIFPLDHATVSNLKHFKRILFIEEGYQSSGIGAHLGNLLINQGYKGVYRNFGINSQFLKSGKPGDLLQECHLDSDGVAKMIGSIEAIEP